MATYLFIWNPAKWTWPNLKAKSARVKRGEICSEEWSCGVTKRIRSGDRAFLMRLGKHPKGLVASGWVMSSVFSDLHWSEGKRKRALYVKIEWDVLLDLDDRPLPIAEMPNKAYSSVNWTPQASGRSIRDDIADQLERDWADFLGKPLAFTSVSPDELPAVDGLYREGRTKKVIVDSYERNPKARYVCVRHYGVKCSVCGIDFEEEYGEIGRGFIHVHHLVPLSQRREVHDLDPVEDLRPVCPNCHAMLHRSVPPLAIELLRALMRRVKLK